jgi:hypothetical protein
VECCALAIFAVICASVDIIKPFYSNVDADFPAQVKIYQMGRVDVNVNPL